MVITYYDIVIIGGGIIGENILYSLKQHTKNMAIIDNSDGFKATHAAGGMLGAQNEFTEDSPLYQLSIIGQQMMPEHIHRLEAQTNTSIDIQQHGLLKIASPDNISSLKSQYEFLSQHQNVHWIEQQEMKQFANGTIHNDFQHAIWIPSDGQVNAAKYLQSLKIANQDIQHIDDTVINISKRDSQYYLEMKKETIAAQQLIIAAGCKSDSLLNQLGFNLDIKGAKGEVLTLHHPELHLKETLFQTNGHYIVPKSNHTYLIGATTSYNTSKKPGAKGVQWLLDETFKLIPAFEESSVLKVDCGFRPETAIRRPVIDQLDDHLFVATGHYRNGILLSRATGELVRQMIFDNDQKLVKQFKNKFKIGVFHENIYQ